MSEKTERPTSRRLRDARSKGEVAYSKDVTQTLLILALFGHLLASGARIAEQLGQMLLLPVTLLRLDFPHAAYTLAIALLGTAAGVLLPFIAIVLGVGIFADALQVGVIFALERIRPSTRHLAVLANARKILSGRSLVELLKSLLKIALLCGLLAQLIRDALPALAALAHTGMAQTGMAQTEMVQTGLPGLGQVLARLLETLLTQLGLGYGVIALADLAWQRWQYRKGLMMSRDEVRRELRQTEGDPCIKRQRKQLHQELQQSSALQSARTAAVIVAHAPHLAVALDYAADATPLPLILAKGEGALARAMLDAARAAGVPVVQNIPLARALTAQGESGQYIPSELVEPVAETLRLLWPPA